MIVRARLDVDGYLQRLGLTRDVVGDPARPTAEGLRLIHRAHVERVPYETLEFQLGRPTTVDPYESAARIIRGRGGYCFHLNGALATLLGELGYRVTWHVGGVQGTESSPAGANANHLALTVVCDGTTWLVDAGLGDGPHEPIPLRPGAYRQGPFTYRMEPSTAEPGGWRFVHDLRGSFLGMDFVMTPATPADFAEKHRELSTSPDSGFVRTVTVARRDATGVYVLRDRTLTHKTEAATARTFDGPSEWFAMLADLFGLTLPDVDDAERTELWRRADAGHAAWLERTPT